MKLGLRGEITSNNIQSIFIDIIAPKWIRAFIKLAYFPSRDFSSTPGYLAYYLCALPSSDRSHMRSCSERSTQTFVFCPSLLPSATKTFIPAHVENIFAIEAQNSNENCSTSFMQNKQKKLLISFQHSYLFQLYQCSLF